MPPTPEEKKQMRMMQMVIGLNGLTVVMLVVGTVLGAMALTTKMNVKEAKEVEKNPMPGPIIAIEDQVYNLGEPNRYMKAAIRLELDVAGMKEKEVPAFTDEAKKRLPQIRDLIVTELSGKTYREVATPQGKEQLKEELRLRINQLLQLGQVREVMFTSFAVQ
jgi:flagellar FliL protein